MSTHYAIDSTRVSHREYWWGTRSPAVLLGWLLKWLRVRIPGSTDDPNVEFTATFLVDALPMEVQQRFQPIATTLMSLGFIDPVYHLIQDTATATTIFWATYRHNSGQHIARIHQRIWQQAKSADRGTFVVFLTALADGTFVGTSSGKPDLDTPQSVPMLRRQGLAPVELWPAHLEFVAGQRQSGIQPIASRHQLLEAIERHHILLRDFNVARGVFRPRSSQEQTVADSAANRFQEAAAGGLQHPEVLAEIDRIQTARPGWGNAIAILVISIIAFLAAGSGDRDWRITLWLIPILLIHEGGHWIAMKIFGYRNLRMFFIPLFGAAVTGRHWNVPGWKKAIVSLAGPVPGILLGAALAVAGLVTHREWLNEAAFLFIFINGFNLLPVLPLDGGHVLHAVLFCRNRWLDIVFRGLTIGGLLLLALGGFGRFLPYIAVGIAVGLPLAFRIGKVIDNLRRTPFPPMPPGEEKIPLTTADTIVTALKAALPAKTDTKTLALQTVNVFETLNARPPGALGAIAFLIVHSGSVVLALVCALLLILEKHGGGLGDFARAAFRQPPHSVTCHSVEHWSGRDATNDVLRNILAATLKNADVARAHFGTLSGRLPAEATLTLFGESLLLTLPGNDDDARERWFAEFQQMDTNAWVGLTNQSVSASLMFITPGGQASTNMIAELDEYLQIAALGDLVPPWSPEAGGAAYQSARRARQAWHVITTNTAAVWHSSAVKDIGRQIAAANRRGARAEAQALIQKQESIRKREADRIRDDLRSRGLDSELIDLNARLADLSYTNRTERVALHQLIARKLGGATTETGMSPGPNRSHGVRSGFYRVHGVLVEMQWATFTHGPTGLPSFLEWLCRNHCTTIKYEIFRGSASGEDEL